MGYTFFDLACDVLKNENKPLTVSEIWEVARERGLVDKLSSYGRTPINTLSARLSTDVLHNETPTFIKIGEKPSKYMLASSKRNIEIAPIESQNVFITKNRSFNERDLHVILSSFVKANEHFGCLTKTIYHENSKKRKSGMNKWLHPDIVGVHFPFKDYAGNTLKLLDVLKVNPYKLYSFELKVELSFANLREYYFQAVSNSSWAHEGYLVALNISNDVNLIDEIRRLNNAFGIGVIILNPEHFMQSDILFSARERESLDWDTVNRLVAENNDFKKFLDDLMEDITVGKVKSNYDTTYDDEEIMREKCIEMNILKG